MKNQENAPVFRRRVYEVQTTGINAKMKIVQTNLPACRCPRPEPKSDAKAAVCGECGGAILTAREREYLKSLTRK
jgi:hypothetical protein